MSEFEDNKQIAILYAYRYLLGREPEDPSAIVNNSLDWKDLRTIFMDSPEYKSLMPSSDWVPSGHFYSPIPDKECVKDFWETHPDGYPITDLDGIDLNLESQYILCDDFEKVTGMDDFWPMERNAYRRYFVNNEFFSIIDAIVYFHMIRCHQPKRIIEIGSGFSSAVALDANEAICDNQINFTFIEPYPERLHSLLSEDDKSGKKVRVIESNLQDVDLSMFKELSRGDILFVDSTHVAKFESDVNYIIFKILPCLKSGVLIHFHDVLYPFDYLKEWLIEGRAWNEAYMLHAFLQYNDSFCIKFWLPALLRISKEKVNFLGKYNYLKDLTGSLWLEKK